MKKTAAVLIPVLLSLAIFGSHAVNLGKANFLPSIDPSMVIETPHHNRTYTVNMVTLNFTATTNWGTYPFFYSLDGQENVTVQNVTIVSTKEASPPSGLEVARTTVRCSCVLFNLTQGWHNLTLYMVTDHAFNLYRTYEKGEILASESTQFFTDTAVEPESFPTVPGVALSIAAVAVIVAAGLLLYNRKRRKEAQQK